MPRIILRVDDVGRKPEDTPENGTDGDLDYFFKWREAAGLRGLPVVYGVTPCWLTKRGYQNLYQLRLGESLAVHGWDHVKGATVTQQQMLVSMLALKAETYIPPNNMYSERTITDWEVVGGLYVLGGFDKEHHDSGEAPKSFKPVLNLVHYSAYQPLYGHAHSLPKKFDDFKQDYPIVATLHVPWDKNLDDVKEFVQAVKPYLVPIGSV